MNTIFRITQFIVYCAMGLFVIAFTFLIKKP